jgi:Zn-dependent protease
MNGILSSMSTVDFSSPAFWAVMIGWVMSVTLHEYAHGIVGYWGGDYTIRERGGLTLNPLQYVDPFMSIILPVVFLMLGGIPLPGGATYIRHDLIRNRHWDSAVSAAGPAMNLILFGLLAIPLLPSSGWINPALDPIDWTVAQKFVSAMCFLMLLAAILNLIPVPTLDGFGIISPYLSHELQDKLNQPQVRSMCMFGYFLLLWQAPGFMGAIDHGMKSIMGTELHYRALAGFEAALYNRSI